MAKQRPPSYTPAPTLPEDPVIRQRFAEIVKVLTQTETVAGAARTLGLSRNHFQTLLHRTIAAMLDELTPKPAGRPAKPEREVALEIENANLRAQIAAAETRAEMIEGMMRVVGGIASGKTPIPRARSKKTKPEDPEPGATRSAAAMRTAAVTAMREMNVPTALCAEALRVSRSTIRRHARPNVSPTSRKRPSSEAARQVVRADVRATHGLIGAAALNRKHGVSRRECAQLKKQELRELEHERRQHCARVRITSPRIVRGFDAMHLDSLDGKRLWLIAADASVPYRTSVLTVQTYDAAHVIAALTQDFERHGPPLVLRLDRIACQRTPEVEAFLARYHVLALHGPPRHPYYYGQLERQNREHRVWYTALGLISAHELATAAEAMRTALNTLWPRPSLAGWTPEQAWQAAAPIDVNRAELRRDVERRALGHQSNGIDVLVARRRAIETSLQERGLLTITQGGWC